MEEIVYIGGSTLTVRTPSERSVELPWATDSIAGVRSWLDVGYAWMGEDWELPVVPERATGIDLIPPFKDHPFTETIVADVTEYEFTEKYDLITCISTLEHIGCDNSLYCRGAYRRIAPVETQRALVAKLRNLGRLLVSVPYGAFGDYGWFLQYDQGMVRALNPSGERYFRLLDEWQECDPADIGQVLYRPHEKRASAVALLEFQEGV